VRSGSAIIICHQKHFCDLKYINNNFRWGSVEDMGAYSLQLLLKRLLQQKLASEERCRISADDI